ncbi:MAG: hypothetical protein H6599_07985 [Flavobacteriales bacterium]|nr:hypothetical protein [Flavobacteriales bacterium]
MTFEKKIAAKSDLELIEILENRENYVPKFIEYAEFEIQNRDISQEHLTDEAKRLVIAKVQEKLKSYTPLKGRFEPPSSYFLSKEDVLEITRNQFIEWIERKEDLKIDVWKYVIAAALV